MSSQGDIAQQFLNGGVIPADLVGQASVSKTYVDGQIELRDAEIASVASVASTAQATIDSHQASASAHNATSITYSGSVSASTVKSAIDTQNQRIDNIVASGGTSNIEIVDARQPATGSAFPVLRDRLNSVDTQLSDIVINVLHPPGPLVAAGGKGETDDTAALLAVKSYILANGGIFYVPANANCFVSGDLDLFGLTNVRVEGMISGTGTDKILTVGYTSNQITATSYFFNNANNIMLRFTGLKNADSKVNQCSHVQLWADGDIASKASLAYSRFTLGIITKLEFNSQGSAIGWINENVFFGGRVSELVMDGNYHHNNNEFFKMMFDSGKFTINKAGYNTWIGCRFEGTPDFNPFGVGTTWNRFRKSWYSNPGSFLLQTAVPNYTDNGSGNKITPEDNADYSYRKLFEINARTSNYNTSRFTRNADTITGLSFSNVWESDYIKLLSPLGFQYLSDAALFRASVYFYDSSKTLITTQPTAIMSGVGYTWITDHYINTTNVSDAKLALFPNPTDSTIVYAKIIFQQYAAGTFESGMVKVLEQKGKETNIITLKKYNKWNSNVMPTSGTWDASDYVENNTKSVVGTAGSRYIVKGWIRLTTGSSHVLNTDWSEDRALTGT